MRGRFFVALAVGVLLVASEPALATSSEIPGRPGQYAVTINIGVDKPEGTFCYAVYDEPPPGGDEFISNGDDGFAAVRIVETKKHLIVKCKTVDNTTAWEANAEVGYADEACFLVLGDGEDEYPEGDGKVTRANDRHVTADGVPNSNVMMTCKLDLPEDER